MNSEIFQKFVYNLGPQIMDGPDQPTFTCPQQVLLNKWWRRWPTDDFLSLNNLHRNNIIKWHNVNAWLKFVPYFLFFWSECYVQMWMIPEYANKMMVAMMTIHVSICTTIHMNQKKRKIKQMKLSSATVICYD